MEEALVILACLHNVGCPEVGAEYYRRHEVLQTALQRGETEVRKHLSPYIIDFAAPLLGTQLGYAATVRVSRKATLTLKPKDGLLVWSYQWD